MELTLFANTSHLRKMLKNSFPIMQLTIVFTILLSLQSSAGSYAQKVTISVEKAPLEKVFSLIEKQTGYHFYYKVELLRDAPAVTASVKDVPLESALSLIFRHQPLDYNIIERNIIIKQKPRGFAVPSAVRQTIPVSGRVVDETNRPLAGVSVIVKGSKTGTTTDSNGRFSLSAVQPEDVLVLSGANVEGLEVKVNGRSELGEIKMKFKIVSSDEVVITGYQTIKETRMTGSTETIKARDIANKGYTKIEDILKGQLSGVATMSLSGRPGAQSQIRIRGINSLTGESDPMWIVDGMPMQGDVPQISMGGTEFQETVLTSGIGNIAPDDIESITILKDAAASAIYGARAANGVIVITTKRGTAGKSFLSIQSSYAISEAPKNRLVMMDSKQKIAFEKGIYADFPGLNLGGRVYQIQKQVDNGLMTRHEADAELDRLASINTNWFDEIFRRGQTQNHFASLSGGNEKTQYYGSLSYLAQVGVMPNNKYENKAANMKITHDFNDRLRIHLNVRSAIRDDRSSASVVNPLNYATFANPYEQLYDAHGAYAFDRSYYPQLSGVENGYMYDFNILKDLNENTQTSKYVSTQTALKLEYRILKGLMLSSMGTFGNSNNHSMAELVPGSFSSKNASWVKNIYAEAEVPSYLNNGKMTESTSRSESWTIRNQLEFARGFSDGKHYVNALMGQEVSSKKGYGFVSMIPEWDPMYGVATYPDLTGIPITSNVNFTGFGSHSESQDRSVSMFATGSYSFDDRYIIAGSARLDGVDIIGTQNRFSPLWNVSGRWNIYREDFMERFSAIDLLSIRASYGFTGSIDRSVLPFSIMAKRENFTYDGEKIFDRFSPASPPVKWQKKEDRNIGLDASLFGHRINLTVNYYNNEIRDLIGADRIAASTGRTSVKSNVASIRNTGLELSLRTMMIRTKNLSWTTSFNISQNKSVVTQTEYKSLSDYSINTNSTFSDIYSLYVQGEPVKAYYGYFFAGVDPLTGGTLAYIDGLNAKGERLGSLNEEGRYVYNMELGSNHTAEIMHAARGFIGLSYPPVTGGFGTQLNYKRFNVSAQFTFMTGHLIRSFQTYTSGGNVNASARNVLAIEANRWRKPGDITTIPKYENGRTEYLYQLFDFRFEDGSYLKWNNLSFGYNLPDQAATKAGLQRARINFNLSNPLTITKYRGIDPETMGAFTYPSARVYNLSISIGI